MVAGKEGAYNFQYFDTEARPCGFIKEDDVR